MAIRLEQGTRLAYPQSPMAVLHAGRREEGSRSRQDASYKKIPRWVITRYDPALKLGEHAPIHEDLMSAAVEMFGGGDPMKFNNLSIMLRKPQAQQNLQVGRMNSCGFKRFDCTHRNPENCGSVDDPQLIDIDKIVKYHTPIIDVNVPAGYPDCYHAGDVAIRIMSDKTRVVVPCPHEPHECPYSIKPSMVKQTGKQAVDSEGNPKWEYSCSTTGILMFTIEHWHKQSVNQYLHYWTKSYDSIRNMANFLNDAEWLWSKATLDLTLVQIRLNVRKGSVIAPDGTRKPQPEAYMVYDGQFVQMAGAIGGRVHATAVLGQPTEQAALNAGAYEVQSSSMSAHDSGKADVDVPFVETKAIPTKQTPQHQPMQQQTGGPERLSPKEMIAIRKLANASQREDDFNKMASSHDFDGLRSLRKELDGWNDTSPPTQQTAPVQDPPQQNPQTQDPPPADDYNEDPPVLVRPDDQPPQEDEVSLAADGVGGDKIQLNGLLWAAYDKFKEPLKLPGKEAFIKDILFLDKTVMNVDELGEEHYKALFEEYNMMVLFMEGGGSLEMADTANGTKAFTEKGWVDAGFNAQRQKALNTVLDDMEEGA